MAILFLPCHLPQLLGNQLTLSMTIEMAINRTTRIMVS